MINSEGVFDQTQVSRMHLHRFCENVSTTRCGLVFPQCSGVVCCGALTSLCKDLMWTKGLFVSKRLFFFTLLKSLSHEKLKFDTIILFLIWP